MDKVNSADLSSSVLLNVVAHRLSGPPHVLKDKSIYVYSEGQKMFEIERASAERRSVKDRRRFFCLGWLRYKGPEQRVQQDRRSQQERRDGYVKISKWSSVKMQDLKLAKYLQPHWKLFKFAWNPSRLTHITSPNRPFSLYLHSNKFAGFSSNSGTERNPVIKSRLTAIKIFLYIWCGIRIWKYRQIYSESSRLSKIHLTGGWDKCR